MTPDFPARLARSVESLKGQTDLRPDLAIIAGTGLGSLLDAIEDAERIPYPRISGFPHSTAPGHRGDLVLGRLRGRPVVAMDGRFHAYEGWGGDDIVLPIHALRALGVKRLVVTNCAGGLNPDFPVPAVMLIEDHVNLTGLHPLSGPNDPRLGLRFPDLSRAYDPGLREAALSAAATLGLTLERGIYIGCHGPELETNAERRFMRLIGGDAVGMSTVLEVIAANHAGIRVLGLSAIANGATGGPDQAPDTVEAIIEATGRIAGRLQALIIAMLDRGDL